MENQTQPTQQLPQQPTQLQPPATPPKKSSNTVLIIVIILVTLIILGAGAWFVWGYFAKKSAENKTKESTSEEISDKIQDLTDLFKYPKSTLVSLETDTDTGAAADMKMESSDDIETVYQYYEDMIELNGWETGSSGFSTAGDAGWLKVEEKDFRADLDFDKKSNKTEITIVIHSDTDEITSSRIKPEAPGSSTTGSKSGTMPTNSYIISDSDTRVISESELTNLTPWQLKVARNEIYARHGRAFVHKDLQCYFATQSWYSVDSSYSTLMLSYTENKNIATILNYEKKINSPLLGHDSGC